jgi:hypothetical protein
MPIRRETRRKKKSQGRKNIRKNIRKNKKSRSKRYRSKRTVKRGGMPGARAAPLQAADRAPGRGRRRDGAAAPLQAADRAPGRGRRRDGAAAPLQAADRAPGRGRRRDGAAAPLQAADRAPPVNIGRPQWEDQLNAARADLAAVRAGAARQVIGPNEWRGGSYGLNAENRAIDVRDAVPVVRAAENQERARAARAQFAQRVVDPPLGVDQNFRRELNYGVNARQRERDQVFAARQRGIEAIVGRPPPYNPEYAGRGGARRGRP